MSSTFEQHLEQIVADLYGYTNHCDFAVVRDFILDKIVKQNNLLTTTCNVESVNFGSRALGIQNYDSDYDVLILLEFPSYEDIIVRPDQHRPGMVHLDFKNMSFNSFTEDTLLDNRWYLKREEVQTLMQCILMNAHGRTLTGRHYDNYTLRYHRKPNCHTITAESKRHVFSIDFVPAIRIHFDGCDWEGVPKFSPGPKRSNGCTFMMSAIKSEIHFFNKSGQNIKDALLLLRALCQAKDLPKIRNYHLVSLALNLVASEDFEDYSLEDIFLDLLYDLVDAIQSNELSYFCYSDSNLLANLTPQNLVDYKNVLDSAYLTLKTYPGQYKLSYERCSWHFFGDDSDDYYDD
nr:uncharacterized protein LOC108009543 isoform X2 [Drosophila suzukii]XP_036668887.1 uncharacterized protein LOC108009543 isoform X2 [Drosophila suzukii]